VHLFLVLLRALTFQAGQVQPQRFMEKLDFHPDLMELHDLRSFNTTNIYPTDKPISNAKRQKKT